MPDLYSVRLQLVHLTFSSSSDKKKEENKVKGEKEVKTEVKTEVKKETEDEGFISPTAPTSESQEDVKVKKVGL